MAVGQDFTISPYRDWFINKYSMFKLQSQILAHLVMNNEHPIAVLNGVKLNLTNILTLPPLVMVRTSHDVRRGPLSVLYCCTFYVYYSP